MTHEGLAEVKMGYVDIVGGEAQSYQPVYSFNCTWKRAPHGVQVPNELGHCLVEFSTDGEIYNEINNDPNVVSIVYYQEKPQETI